MTPQNVHLGADHAGFEYKEAIKARLGELGYAVHDHGATVYNADDDYPAFIQEAAKGAASDPGSFAIVLGGSGNGEGIAANKIVGIRCAVFYGGDTSIVKLAREHNDANALSLGARFMTKDEAVAAAEQFLSTPFSAAPRHVRRLAKL